MPDAHNPANAEGLPGITRRTFFRDAAAVAAGVATTAIPPVEGISAVSLKLSKTLAGTSAAAADLSALPMQDIIAGYAQWLFYERRFLMMEAFPGYGESFVPMSTIAETFHFPLVGDWRDVPKPSTRAAAVLQLAGLSLAGA